EGSFIGDNNGLALGLIMIVPLLYFLARDEPRRWLRGVLRITLVMSIAAVPFTYSRAGFLGLVVVLFMFVGRTRWKWSAMTMAVVASPVVLSLLPQRWFDRIGTILTYSEDGSAISRLTAWGVSWGVALDNPLFGGGFRVLPHPEVWAAYAPDWMDRIYNAHSIYFEVLAEHGFIGFFLFFGLLGSTVLSMRAVRQQVGQRPDLLWLVDCSYMVETALLAYLVSGAFYNLASFDLVYFLVGVAIILKRLAADAQVAATGEAPASRASQVAPRLPRAAARWQPIST
ncbi:MAG: putative O-glycosylation ligase, exosortase A system-associated, partial [Candidatus Rokuibacteriota bacterium]